MPRMDGMELLRRLRESSDLPVIFLTSKDEEQDEAPASRWAPTTISPSRSASACCSPASARSCAAPSPARAEADASRGRRRPAESDRARAAHDGPRAPPRRHGAAEPVTLTVTEFLILEALAAAPRRDQEPQPADGCRLSGRHLCRRPHDRQPHQAAAAQVPRGRPGVRSAIETLYGAGYSFTDG